MKIRKNHIHLFILLFAVSSLLVHSPPQAFAEEGVIATISVGDSPTSIAFDSENNRMYVLNRGDDNISVISTATNEVIETVSAAGAGGNGNTPHSIAFDSANNRMYFLIGNWNFLEDAVMVLNTADNSISAKIDVGERPQDIAFDSANNRMYVTNYNDDTVSVINTANNSVIATVSVGEAPNGIAFDSANNRMYVTNNVDDTVSVINTANNSVIATISVGQNPWASPASDSVNNRMYVLNSGDNTVSVIDTAKNSVIATVSVGNSNAGPGFGMGFDSTNNRVYVPNDIDGTASVIDTTNSVIDTIPVGERPHDMAFDPVNNRMYVTNYDDGTVSVIGILSPTSSSGGSSRDNNDALINPNPYLTDEILVSVGPNKAIVTQNDGISNIQIQKGDSITITLNVVDGGPVHQTNHYYGQSDIESISLYTNFGSRPAAMNLYHANHFNDDREVSKTFYEWNANRDNVVYDFTKSVTWHNPVVRTASFDTTSDDSNTPAGNKLIITFYSTWNDVIPKSEILVKVADAMMGYSVITLPFTLQVGDYDPSFEDLFGISTNYKFVPLVIDSNVRESLQQWVDPLSGMTDERFVSSLGLDGDKLPGYVKHLAQWVVDDKIDLADLIIAVEYIINVK